MHSFVCGTVRIEEESCLGLTYMTILLIVQCLSNIEFVCAGARGLPTVNLYEYINCTAMSLFGFLYFKFVSFWVCSLTSWQIKYDWKHNLQILIGYGAVKLERYRKSPGGFCASWWSMPTYAHQAHPLSFPLLIRQLIPECAFWFWVFANFAAWYATRRKWEYPWEGVCSLIFCLRPKQ